MYRTKPDSKGRTSEMRIRTITRPSRTRTIRGRKYTAVSARSEIKEFIIYAPEAVKVLPENNHIHYRKEATLMGKKNDKSNDVTDDELKELENLEDLEGDEPDEDEAPKAKKGKKTKGGKAATTKDEDAGEGKKKSRSSGAAPGKSRAAANGKVGTAEIAAAGGCDARTLRMVLRKLEIPKDEETGRYEWDSMKDKTVVKILKELKGGAAEKVKAEGLQRLKDTKAAKDAAEKAEDTKEGKKTKKDKKKSKKA